jgi:3-phenylpropionate/trans-cinnamate dioxygenase ferredoxin reductase component
MPQQGKASGAVIVGAGHAGGELAIQLRQQGWSERIVLIGAEHHPPYQRPPLSKAFLSGEASLESLYLRPLAAYSKADVEFRGGTRVLALDRPHRTVLLSDGTALPYDKLALALGSRPRRLAAEGSATAEAAANYHYLRSIDDVVRIRARFEPGMRLVIVGAGYIGLEAAAVAARRGLRTTVVEALPRVLARVASPQLSAFCEDVHRLEGVDIRTRTKVSGFECNGAGNLVSAVVCDGGTRLAADLVLVAIGIVPETQLAAEAGLAVDDGIVVDEACRTLDRDIVAAGDCTCFPSGFGAGRLRLESVPNAIEQSRIAAATVCGKPGARSTLPWFWSDHYELKLQTAGLQQPFDDLVLRGSVQARSFVLFHLTGGRVAMAEAVNRPLDFMQARRLIAQGTRVDPGRLSDESTPLASLIKA